MASDGTIRPVADIRATGAAWVTEYELAWLCDRAEARTLPVGEEARERELVVIRAARAFVEADRRAPYTVGGQCVLDQVWGMLREAVEDLELNAGLGPDLYSYVLDADPCPAPTMPEAGTAGECVFCGGPVRAENVHWSCGERVAHTGCVNNRVYEPVSSPEPPGGVMESAEFWNEERLRLADAAYCGYWGHVYGRQNIEWRPTPIRELPEDERMVWLRTAQAVVRWGMSRPGAAAGED